MDASGFVPDFARGHRVWTKNFPRLVGTNAFAAGFVMRTTGARRVTSKAEEYRYLARECLQAARSIQNQESRVTLIRMAEVWQRLAEEQEAASQFQPKAR
jgi:hypothetical protein